MTRIAQIFCPNCPRELQFRPEHVGRLVECRFCGFRFRLPTHVPIPCPTCGHEGKVRSENLGLKIRCKQCAHVFRARAKEPSQRPRGAAEADAEVRLLRAEIERRDEELAEVSAQLRSARAELQGLDERARSLADERDTSQGTHEWAAIEAEHLAVGASGAGTEPDLPLADPEADDPSTLPERPADFDLPKTQVGPTAPDGDELDRLRDECDRLRAELESAREKNDQTALGTDGLETLERDLAVARADNVRLSAEGEEAALLVANLKAHLRDREAALAEDRRDRDVAVERVAAIEAEAAALRDRLSSEQAARSEAERLWADERSRIEAERAEAESGRVEAEALLGEARDRLRDAESGRDGAARRLAEAEAARDDLARRLDAASAELASLRDDEDAEATEVRAVPDEVKRLRDAADLRISDLSERLRAETERADRASADRDAARSGADALSRDLAIAQLSLDKLGPAPEEFPSVAGAPLAVQRERIDELMRERDQARRDVARLRSILDRLGAEDPAPG